jgi:hypothetical protein
MVLFVAPQRAVHEAAIASVDEPPRLHTDSTKHTPLIFEEEKSKH